jgi:peptidoglycan L-alanyl-D-glutamate endopeptidase CwlK
MYKFSQRSKERLLTCHPDIIRVMKEVIKGVDCTILEGHRPQEKQDDVYSKGLSKVKWPHSKHNASPSLAVDVAPYPIDWNDTQRFYYFGGYVLGVADQLGVNLRWGGDWDGDNDLSDQHFMDLVHWELRS